MQHIEISGDAKSLAPTPERQLEYQQAAEGDYITDAGEIRAIVRRAVTMSWEDSVFTLDELHGHMIKNFVKYPVPEGKEMEWLEESVYDIWRSQKEMARIAGGVLPSIINTEIDDIRHYGVVKPVAQGTETEARSELVEANLLEAAEEMTDEPVRLAIVESPDPGEPIEVDVTPSIDIEPQPLRPSEIAARLFEEYTGSTVENPKFDVLHIMNLFKGGGYSTQPKDIRNVIKTMADSGYIHSYTTGRNKHQRTWWCMDADTKADVLSDINEGSLSDYLPDMFDSQESVA